MVFTASSRTLNRTAFTGLEIAVGPATFLIMLIINQAFGGSSYAATILLASLSISLAALLRTVNVPSTNPIRLTSLIYIIFFFQLPGLLHLTSGRYPWYGKSYPVDIEGKAAIVVLVFTISLLTGIAASGSKKSSFTQKVTLDNPATPLAILAQERRELVAIFVLLTISVTTGLILGYHPFTRRGELSEVVGVQAPSDLILGALSSAGGALAFFICLARYQQTKSISRFVLASVATIPFLLANSPIAVPRFVLGSLILTGTFLLARPGPRGKLILVLAMIFAQFTIFPLVSDISRGRGTGSFEFAPLRYIKEHGDFDGLQSTLNVVQWVDERGLKYGRQITSATFFFVPRTMFPNKSQGTGGDAATFAGYKFANISAPLPAEFFSDFGFIGLVSLSFLFGIVIRRLDMVYDAASRRENWIVMLAPAFTAGYAFIILRGSLVGVLGPFAASVSLAVLTTRFIGLRRRWL